MTIVDFKAAQKWAKIPKDFQQQLLENVFCRSCGVTRIVDYGIETDKFGIVLTGKCKKCGADVARVIED
ncbi:hypothetical protein [Alkalihalophilus marmarensis]|uniref:hypothetical protein n=1 Tax=Alkalihalophilus marmarensis TaxID=521377 RepID=UPI002DBD32C9|nr:hypothetical protein [Alkalihalophilus marmarensis]MEC2072278.1 hypothetical protein [Alkalihalophilus marmarensis]